MTAGNVIDPDESELIRFQLTLSSRPTEVKAGLQRLCGLYEGHKRLSDPDEHRLLVRALLMDQEALVRRWAYKAIAFLGPPHDAARVVKLVRDERDLENQTWAISAAIALDRNQEVAAICSQAGLPSALPLLLAARLFAHKRWLREHPDPPVINIELADSLTLKWAALLSGYGRAPPNLFHPHHENQELLGKLNGHPEPEVSEYSIWAFWQNPRYSITDMTIRTHEISRCPKNVRRWINRLITKSDAYLATNLDLIDDLRRDNEVSAREGLALGLRRLYIPELSTYILDWHSAEQEEIIRELLLEHMAAYADASAEYAVLAEQTFRAAGRNSGIRKRLLAASAQKPFYGTLKRFAALEQAADAGLEQQTNIFVGRLNVTTIRAGRDINAQNIVGGDMVHSANAAVQRLDATRTLEKAGLEEILEFVKSRPEIPPDHKNRIASAAEQVAITDSRESKENLAETLDDVAKSVGAVSSIASGLHGFVHMVAGWMT